MGECKETKKDNFKSNILLYEEWRKRERLSRVRKGKKFTEEHKRNIALNHADISGKNHPCYGKHFKWITNGLLEQRLDEGKILPEGFQYGRIKWKK